MGGPSDSLGFGFEALWDRRAGMHLLKRDTLATVMRITGPQLSQQLHGRGGHVSWQRFVLLLADPDTRDFAQGLYRDVCVALKIAHVEPFQAWLQEGVGIALRVQLAQAEREHREQTERQIA